MVSNTYGRYKYDERLLCDKGIVKYILHLEIITDDMKSMNANCK